MEVQQCMKLTVTNSSIGLIILIARVHQDISSRMSAGLRTLRVRMSSRQFGARRTAPDGRANVRDGRSALRNRRFRSADNGKAQTQLLEYMRFADLVVIAGWLHPFPFRTRP